MPSSLSWLFQTVDLPLWAVLALASFQRAIAVVRGVAKRRRSGGS